VKGSRRSGFIAILKKELTRFFTDRRMVLTTILLPGLMIFAVYSFIGEGMSKIFTVDEDYAPQAYVVNPSKSLEPLAREAGLPFEEIDAAQADVWSQRIADQEADLLVIFPEDFDQALDEGTSVPDIQVFYNSARTESSAAFETFFTLLDAYKASRAPLFTVNAVHPTGGDLVSDEDATGMFFSLMLPFLILVLLFTSAMGIAAESIAGEKERGTFATMLITPLKRWELALGKIVSISVIALLSGISSFVGIILSLPRMMGDVSSDVGASIYGVADYALLLAVVLSTVLLFVGIISVISAFAKSIKEAGQLVSPLMILVMLIGVLGGFMGASAAGNMALYLIPAYNSVQCMVGIFSFDGNEVAAALTIATNLVVAGVCTFALTRMFGSERIIFSR
jgi:sodium transport system permease protein